MAILNFLYLLVIYPPLLVIQIAFELFDKVFKNPSIAIFGVSGAITIVCLPLYIVAERWQHIEREKQKAMAPMVATIKSVFSGDERFLLLQEFYRQNNYHPIYTLRSSFGILIQIPFFMAAYSYLSQLEALRNVSFLFIRNLGAPDAFAQIGSFSINILPILMTLINIVSGILYTKTFPLKDKIQTFGIAIVFLVLLYNSPAGLVLYWTMNNVFSLVKNIFYKLKNPLKALYILSSFVIVIFIFYMLFINKGIIVKRLFVIGASSIVFFLPLIVKLINILYNRHLSFLTENPVKMRYLFLLFSFSVAILAGFCIPSAVISSSPEEFSFIDSHTNPLYFLVNSFFSSIGLFALWPLLLYFIFGKRIKALITSFFGIFLGLALINSFLFQGNYGLISNVFQFDTTGVLNSSLLYNSLNVLAIFTFIAIFALTIKNRILPLLGSFGLIILITLGVFSLYNSFIIQKGFQRLRTVRENEGAISSLEKAFHLSRDNPNLVIFMPDGAVNGYIKPIFDNRPELYNDYDGFVLYPNTVSFARHTLLAVPALWGGYEYAPMEMNINDSIPLKEKHNQALLLLPSILEKVGYDITVTDPSQSNYEWISDVSIYDKLPNTNAFNTIGRYSTYWFNEHNFGSTGITSETIKRNSLFFSFMKIIPPSLRFIVYDKGRYWGGATKNDSINGFIDNYAVLDYLPKLTSFNAKKSQALLITNEITHQSIFLQYPDYVPVPEVADYGPGNLNKSDVFHSNAAMLIRFGLWLRKLKEEGVYDNTRIIIVADHGARSMIPISDEPLSISGEVRETYNPLLMVKDFGGSGKLSESSDFMTNADVPLLALKGIVDNPINPFTGNPLPDGNKDNGILITNNHQPMPADHGKYQYKIKSNQWILVKDDIRLSSNWEKADK